METQYQVVINIPVASGFVELARFLIADTKDDAGNLFSQLEGIPVAIAGTPAIRFDLVEFDKPLSVVIGTIYCSLREAGQNCQTIIKEIFRELNIG